MHTIGFVILPMTGTLHASLKLARELSSKEHRVFFVGLPDSEEGVRSNGFEFVPIFDNWFPKGFFSAYDKISTLDRTSALKAARKIVINFNVFIDALIAGETNPFINISHTLQPDLLLFLNCDETVMIPALLAYEAGIKSIYVSDILGRGENAEIPPITSHIIPTKSLASSMRISLAWTILRFRWLFIRKGYSLFGLQVDWPKLIKKLALKCGYPWNLVETSTDTFTFNLKLPELILCPQEFEFPHAEKPGRYYVEASIDLNRREPPFPFEKLDDNRPIAYCALGTMAWLSKDEYVNFFQTVIEASSIRPDWQWVLAIGNDLSLDEFKSIPLNVTIVHRAPQLEILKRATLMITHGGLNSIKECIYFGVPMIVFPKVFDAPGNTARVVYHGLGVKGDINRICVKGLQDLIEQIDQTSYYRTQVRLMRRKFMDREVEKQGLNLIETFLINPNTSHRV